jgi:peptidoglycan/xylan/chitin deacetylase (PgdA/CDA1 family)
MRKSHLIAAALHKTGGTRLLDLLWGNNRLTVLAYHRIIESDSDDFTYYQPNVSATPAMFKDQMDFVDKRFNVINLDALVAFIEDGKPLPPRPLLITFDDGYLDNYENAFPILKSYGFPAVIFLMTASMDNPVRPWWDACAYYFQHTAKSIISLPIGSFQINVPEDRIRIREAVMRQLKKLPEIEKQAVMAALPEATDVKPPIDPPLFVNWDQVRDLVANGVACQPHTVTHPILTRIPDDEVQRQLTESRDCIKTETGQAITAFAYPNGTPADYNKAAIEILRNLDYKVAFTLTPGPAKLDTVKEHPLQIARVFLGRRDTFETFVLKVMGAPALTDKSKFIT